MVKRMLIDATHREETRVVVVNGTRLEELDVESSTKKQLKGNIYLAKVVRVEPSLQAAFVEYGGNRHGFLAFNEIHPDYYQIPVADRQALLAEQRQVMSEVANGEATEAGDGEGESVDVVGGDDEDVERRRPRTTRHYKIQEVIKRRQILLVQVVKEERGNKGAALTTYLSLAGRYCVLMPNTARGGGVSRKIVNAQDRKRLKAITSDLDIPEGMAVIVRTAGSERTKAEIKRDYEYLLRMWDNVRELTLNSTAPALVYAEADLIKRAIRDHYSRDIDEILVEGEDGYRQAKDFMRMLTPSHAKKVKLYRDPAMPLYYRFQIETQLDAMHSPIVQLKSGGYIVINPTEALVSIDVNSGRATKERHIEETALKTNVEAADEIARQLRLRDLAGLIVIDFIDMEESRNNHAVERRLKEALKNDRARIQFGRISTFGLLEMSRQRLRPSLQESTFQPCTHCGGSGQVRSVESTAIYILRAIEEEGIRGRSSEVTVTVAPQVALYILNQKREALAEIENRYEFQVYVQGDDTLIPPNHRMDRVKLETPREEQAVVTVQRPVDELAPEEEEEEAPLEEAAPAATAEATSEAHGDEAGERRRRRRRKRRRRGEEAAGAAVGETAHDEAARDEAAGEAAPAAEPVMATAEDTMATAPLSDEDEETAEQRPRRRGKRGGRRRRRGERGEQPAAGEAAPAVTEAEPAPAPVIETTPAGEAPAPAIEMPVAAVEEAVPALPEVEPAAQPEAVETVEAVAPKKPARRRPKKAEAAEATAEALSEAEPAPKKATRVKAEKAKPAKPKAKKAEKAPAADKATKPSRRKKAAAEAPATEAAETAAKPPARTRKAKAAPAAPEPAVEAPAVEAPALSEAAAAEQPASSTVVTALPEDAKPKRGWWRR